MTLRIALVFALLMIVFVGPAALAADGSDLPEVPNSSKADTSTHRIGCLDDSNYYCFARCDFFWDRCVEGSIGCIMYWPGDQCFNNYQRDQCCIHTLQAGLF
ncbi:MAG: hypothetical protein AAF481_00610 [Acidobacteriota bacterium]